MSASLAIILVAVFTAVSCAILGSFLVLRRMTMIGDAISHAVLPGIAVAYWLSQSRATWWMFLGAAITGIAATLIIEFLRKKLRVQGDASIGMTFTGLFAIGVILITFWSDSVDLDQECVLYGELAYVPFDLWILDGYGSLGPKALWASGGLLLLVISYVLIGYKGLLMSSFNEDYAAVLGIGVVAWNLSLMSMVSLATVISFESVGAILVVALLVAPGATAYTITRRLKPMLLLAVLFGALNAVLGYWASAVLDASIAGTIAAMNGLTFLVVFLGHRIAEKKPHVEA